MDRPFRHLVQIERLVREFLDGTLPCEQWTHRAHLAVGLWHAREFAAAEALDRVRAGIRSYNAKCGVVDSPTRGYHETITRLYMHLLGKYLASLPDASDWVAVTNRAFDELGERELPLRHYTRERLMSAEARSGWIEPDLKPLD